MFICVRERACVIVRVSVCESESESVREEGTVLSQPPAALLLSVWEKKQAVWSVLLPAGKRGKATTSMFPLWIYVLHSYTAVPSLELMKGKRTDPERGVQNGSL